MTLRVAVLDSGFDPREAVLGRNFSGSEAPLPHGAMVAALVRDAAPDADLLDGRLFGDRLQTTAATVAEAVDWALAQGAGIINLSLGLRDDRDDLAAAIARSLAAGVLIVAPAPARGGPVYPAAWPGVIAVTGDARCKPGEFSLLDDRGPLFGASPRPLAGPPSIGGASFATARVSGALARFWPEGEPLQKLRAACRYQGRERR